MKIIFLDIDGVLNSDYYFNSDSFRESLIKLNLENASLKKIADKAPYLHIDPFAIKLLNELVVLSGAEVVLSSSWRKIFVLEQINRFFKKRGATFKLSNYTPMKLSSRYRAYEVKEYLEDLSEVNKITPESFVILDDIDEFSNYKKQFIQTSGKVGLTIEDVDKALKILDSK